MHSPALFKSFFLGGFECSTHRRHDGERLDLLTATRHDELVVADYRALNHHGIQSVRDGIRWHLIERRPGEYRWDSLLPMLRAARDTCTQVIWDLCHYGWPDHLDIWQPRFVDSFARFAAAVAEVVRDETDGVPFYAPINEISYWAWAGGDEGQFNPLARGRGFELKHQLVRASIAAIEAIRAVDARSRFVQIDPVIHVRAPSVRPGPQREAERLRLAQFEAWDMLCGKQWPGLGGDPAYLDIVGVNYYPDNQWYLGGETIELDNPDYRPLCGILTEVWRRYGRPILIAETGAEAEARRPWLNYVGAQVDEALARGVPIEGVCLYPIVDYPGWTNERHCPVGLFGFADAAGGRPIHQEVADELHEQQRRHRERVTAKAICHSP